jgi:hypothetical protein
LDEFSVVSSPGFVTVTARGNSRSPAAEAAGHSDGRHRWSSSSGRIGGIGGGQRRAGGLRLTSVERVKDAMHHESMHRTLTSNKKLSRDSIETSLQGIALLGILYLKFVSVLELGAEEVDAPTLEQLGLPEIPPPSHFPPSTPLPPPTNVFN